MSVRDEFCGIVPDRSMQSRFMCVICGSVRVELKILRKEDDTVKIRLYCASCGNYVDAEGEVEDGG